MDIANQLTCIFCEIDDFCKEFDKNIKQQLLPGPDPETRGPAPGLSISEVMTILIMFHNIRFRDFKTFYSFVERYWKKDFPTLPSYPRFISIMNRAILPLTIFTQLRSGKRTDIYYIDSSCLPVCHIKRIDFQKSIQN